MDLQAALPALLPAAIRWAETEASRVLQTGAALTPAELEIARSVGVVRPELIRIGECADLPVPETEPLKSAAVQAGLAGPDMAGLTLGYTVYIRRGCRTRRLLSHEFRHVYQYERYGSIAAFLPVYLSQVVEVGYAHAPLELDARAHELRETL